MLCLDDELKDVTIESLKAFSEEQLLVSTAALDTTKKYELYSAFKDNIWVV